MGSETYDVICDKVAPDSPRTKTYQDIVATVAAKDAASADETVDEYLVALRRIAVTCNFGAYLDTALRNQLVFGIKRNDIRSRLLEKRQLTLQDAREIAVSMELSRKGGAEIEGGSSRQEVHAVHHPAGKKEKQSAKKMPHVNKSAGKSASDGCCFRCGDKSHFANACKHKQIVCSYCKLTGHLAKVCLKKSAAAKSDSRSTNKSNPVQTNYVDQTGSTQCAESVEVREVCTVESSSRCKKFLLDISVNDKCVRFEVDTGSPVSIISAEDKNRLFPAARLRKCDTDLVSYCNTSIDVLGILDASVEFGGNGMKLPLYVVNSGKHPLLGREWLKVMSVDWNCVFQGPSVVNTIAATASPGRDAALKALLERYPKVFDSSIGRISNVQANLPLKKNARPVFLKARKIPFSMVKTVEDELEKLVAEGVLTKVNSSNWATPIVPVKKSQNRVRICGDYKQTVNPNLVVDKHPQPTVDELFTSLAGGKKFSKIDLVQAYLQLEVVPEDRELLTLSTHRGLYRPNRLMYGVASAPAIWQRQMEVILQGIEGIFGEHKGLPVMSALRMQHYATYLQCFDYEIRFRKSGNHANADAMSRFPLDISDPENEIEESDAVELSQIDTLPLTAAELGQVTAEDHTVQKLIQGIKHGQSVEAKDRFGVEQHEFSLQKGCLLEEFESINDVQSTTGTGLSSPLKSPLI
nr:uncharacterized protein K02A2.6-like [Aedes albopictus]